MDLTPYFEYMEGICLNSLAGFLVMQMRYVVKELHK
jgi:hypothetical protein